MRATAPRPHPKQGRRATVAHSHGTGCGRDGRRSLLRLRDDDAGSTLPLITAFTALALALILVGMAATSLYLERKRLLSTADAAALAGAEAFELADVALDPADPAGLRIALRDDAVRGAVDAHLGAAGPGALDGLRIVVAGSPDGQTAEVTLEARWAPPVVIWLLPDGLPIEATATARAVLQ